MSTQGEFTRILGLARRGDSDAVDRLYAIVYPQLRGMARRQLGGRDGTLNPTALVHEAYLKLVEQKVQKKVQENTKRKRKEKLRSLLEE